MNFCTPSLTYSFTCLQSNTDTHKHTQFCTVLQFQAPKHTHALVSIPISIFNHTLTKSRAHTKHSDATYYYILSAHPCPYTLTLTPNNTQSYKLTVLSKTQLPSWLLTLTNSVIYTVTHLPILKRPH